MSPAGRVTNLFLPEPEVAELLDRGELRSLDFPGGLALLRDQGAFRRLYYAARTPAALAALHLPPGEFITDIVGRESDIALAAEALRPAGFTPYKRFQRMSRPGGGGPYPNHGVRPARASESVAIHSLIHTHFDPRAEHLPSVPEITFAVEDGTILIAEESGALAALLFHAGTAVTTTLRYWLVLPEFRGRQYGHMLLQRYFELCAGCRRFLLWVQSDNARAIAQYERAGYKPDGLLDLILRRNTTE